MKRSVVTSLIFFLLFELAYIVWSYSLTDPNLVLINNSFYWRLQNFMWQTFFHNSVLLTQAFLFIITGWFLSFLWLVSSLKEAQWQRVKLDSRLILIYLAITIPMLFAYNALSHDVFNYIFNAKMVTYYEANPHLEVALSFADDEWTRFMHNTHTPAPYGYIWTGLSLIPYAIGGGKFITTWLAFSAFSLISLFALLVTLILSAKHWLAKIPQLWLLSLVLMNPLVLIEVIGNSHNDLWMMVPAISSLLFFTQIKTISWSSVKWFLLGFTAILVSIGIKFATLALLPLIAIILFEKIALLQVFNQFKYGPINLIPESISSLLGRWLDEKLVALIPLLASILMFLPLLTSRSQQFHPWYLLWPLVWLPLIKNSWWRNLMIIFSLSSLWRYAPWLMSGGFEGDVLLHQKLITWVPAGLFVLYSIFKNKKNKKPKTNPPPRLEVITD